MEVHECSSLRPTTLKLNHVCSAIIQRRNVAYQTAEVDSIGPVQSEFDEHLAQLAAQNLDLKRKNELRQLVYDDDARPFTAHVARHWASPEPVNSN